MLKKSILELSSSFGIGVAFSEKSWRQRVKSTLNQGSLRQKITRQHTDFLTPWDYDPWSCPGILSPADERDLAEDKPARALIAGGNS